MALPRLLTAAQRALEGGQRVRSAAQRALEGTQRAQAAPQRVAQRLAAAQRVRAAARRLAAVQRLLRPRTGPWQLSHAVAGLLTALAVVAACTAVVRAVRQVPELPPATVTISTGNLTFTSARQAAGPATAPAASAGGRSAGVRSAGARSAGARSVAARSVAARSVAARSAGAAAHSIAAGQHTLTSDVASYPAVVGSARAPVAAGRTALLIDRRPDSGIAVRVSGGRLASVSVTTGPGTTVPGSLSDGGTAWRTRWALAPDQAYHVTAVAVTRQGRRTVTRGVFRTLTPHHTFTASSTMTAGQTYGVGMPIMIQFSRPVAVRSRAEVERSMQLFASRPVTGAWYWMSNSEVWFRPQHFWPAHTQVRLDAHLKGVQGAPGVYGSADLRLHFRIGGSLVVVASTASHHMKVWWNGRLKGNWPISTGEPGLDTPDGHYLSFAMGNPVDMDSATFGVMPGDPGYYNVMVYDSVQFTGSGDYIHSAPWSVGEQGYVNVSHGCVNVAPAQAAWYYDHSLIGDPITVVGSPLRGTWGDGWTIWFLSWPRLLAGSATGQAEVAGSSGSRFEAPSLAPATAVQPRRLRTLVP